MSQSPSFFDRIIDKNITEIEGEYYFSPLGIYWKPYILKNNAQVEKLKFELRRIIKQGLFLIIICIAFVNPKFTFLSYLGTLCLVFALVIYKVKKIQKEII